MDANVPSIPPTMTVNELADRIARGDPLLRSRQGVPIVDDTSKLVGIITRGDLLRALEQNDPALTVLDAGCAKPIVAYPDEMMSAAVARMVSNNVGRLLVVSRADTKKLVGYIGRSGVLAARTRRLEEEHLREGRFMLPTLPTRGA